MSNNKIMLIAGALLLLLACTNTESDGQGTVDTSSKTSLNVCTYNIGYNDEGVDVKAWKNRRQYVHDLIRLMDVDILGTQEGTQQQVNDVRGNDYDVVSAGGFWNKNDMSRDEKLTQHLALYYKRSRFTVLDKGSFWLSATPDAKSWGWDGAESRGCVWAKLRDNATRKEFAVFVTQLDHRGTQAKLNGAKLVLQKVKELAKGVPTFCMGDFNGTPYDSHIKQFAADGLFKSSKDVCTGVKYGPQGTLTDYNKNIPMNRQIDYIWVTTGIHVNRYGVLAEMPNYRYLSDHNPVFVSVTM